MRYGIDCGSKFIKIARLGADGSIDDTEYKEHFGKPEKFLNDIAPTGRVVLTGSHAGLVADMYDGASRVDDIASVIEALRFLNVHARHVVCVGASTIGLIGLDDNMRFTSYRQNTLCAAGTGSFIDEQMHRLGFSYDDIASLEIDENPPGIATRCAVFAKSDVIHRQQEGYGPASLWSGLCRGVSMTMLQSVFRGQLPEEEVLFIGGIFLNRAVRFWTSKLLPSACFHERGHILPAWGAALLAEKAAVPVTSYLSDSKKQETSLRKLEIAISSPTREADITAYDMDACEVRIHRHINACCDAALGIDIGSTSTKLVLLDAQSKEVVADIYTRTAGNPLAATANLFSVLKKISAGELPNICACATTGSGRRLVGSVIGADVIVNEITAHFAGARHVDDSIETIFEIGGQDSKYIRGKGGMVVDCNMNFVCAAGTGSFIEEQAKRLGFNVREIGDRVIGLLAPAASDRCTVFMEQDINAHLRNGHSRQEALAAVVVSIAKNYLNRVVGARPVTGEKIFFQGATARNRGLIAAFEMLTGKEIVVSEHCHVMGAYGAALIALEKPISKSSFRGFNALDDDVTLMHRVCADCTNHCTIITACLADGKSVSWGHLCGREEGATGVVRGKSYFQAALRLLQEGDGSVGPRGIPKGTIGIPLALSMFNYIPLWKCFLSKLGFDVMVSDCSSEALRERAVRIARTDFCFPMKIALSHFALLAENKAVDMLFFPSLISEEKQKNGMPRVFCPYVISVASCAASLDLERSILSPVIDFRDPHSVIVNELHRVFAPYGITKSEIRDAFKAGWSELTHYRENRYRKGCDALQKAQSKHKKSVVFIGRPYNLYDTVINLNLPERFKYYGVDILPFELLIEQEEKTETPHMYWNYGEMILRAAKKVREMEDVFPVYLTNFSCGPDSFVLSRFEAILEGKPYLILELDEHGSETGYITRIEAFLDIILERRGGPDAGEGEASPFVGRWRRKSRKLWIPPMHEFGARLFAAGFRAWGFDAEALPGEDRDAHEHGKRGIRGGECLPAAATIGAFLKKMQDIDADPSRQAIFMPTAEGPCRFGQYAVLHRKILDRAGFSKTMIFAPSSVNSYMGMPQSLRTYLWDALLSADMLMKAVLKVRPYEVQKGDTDRRAEEVMAFLEERIERKANLIAELPAAISSVISVPKRDELRPLVGIVGEIYVRCNPFCNDNLSRVIESAGGEAWLAPMSEWVLYTSWFENYYAGITTKNPIRKALVSLKNNYLFNREHEFEEALRDMLADRFEPHVEEVLKKGMQYLPLRFEGEAILTVGRTWRFFEDGASMVVNCAPFGCMPGNITASLFANIQEHYQKPVLTLFYDGETSVNRAVEIYLRNMGVSEKAIRL